MITPGKMIFVIICGILGGFMFAIQSFHVFAVRNAPVVTGRILTRQPIRQYSIPKVDFTIQLEGGETRVHAFTARYLIDKIPATVRFHYNGDPRREVFLFEHEENPYWIFLFFWGASLALGLAMRSTSVRRSLEWEN